MKKFIITIILIAVGVFAMDRLCEKVFWTIAMHANNGIASKMRNIAYETEADILLMGTSRCNHHYVPSIISDSTGMSVYNIGFDGAESIYAHYIELCLLTARYSPKMICLDILYSDFATDTLKESNPYQALCKFTPYYGKNAEADSVFKENPDSYLYDISHIYRYNEQALTNIGGLIFNPEGDRDNGYIPLKPAAFDLGSPIKMKARPSIDKNKLKYLQKFIDKCKDNNIELVFSISPCYAEDLTDRDFFREFFKFAESNDIPVYNNYSLYFDHPELFKDYGHMCDAGAQKFSRMMGGNLKKHLETKR